jgi:hypothetical protein
MIRVILFVFISSLIFIFGMFIVKKDLLFKIEKSNVEKKRKNIIILLVNEIKKIDFIRNFSWNNFFQKILSKIRVFLLKIEKRVGDLLLFLRRKSINKKNKKD